MFAFGSESWLCLCYAFASYAAMAISRRRCGHVVFAGSFGYLIYYHSTAASGEAWKAGNIDITGLLMVMTLKVTACALNYQDAGRHERIIAERRQASKRPIPELGAWEARRYVHSLPDPLDYAGWLMFPCTLVVGPAIEFRDYEAWVRGAGLWGSMPSASRCLRRAAWLVAYSCVFCFVHLAVMRVYTIDSTYLSPNWSAKPLWLKFWELHILGQGSRGKYFFCWVWADAACCASGLGFGAPPSEREFVARDSNAEKTKPPAGLLTKIASAITVEDDRTKWATATNVHPMGVELSATFVDIPKHWNVQTGEWLRHYVYERPEIRMKGTNKRDGVGFLQLLITQTVSGVWHGLYAGYWLFFVSSAVYVHGSKAVWRWQRACWPRGYLDWVISFPHWVLTTVGLNYLCGAFMLVTYRQCVDAWRSVYFLPHLIVLAMVAFGELVGNKAVRRAKRRAEEEAKKKAREGGEGGDDSEAKSAEAKKAE